MSLKIYKASAGSGKTYTLAKNFINLLIANPCDYEHILAVTFTNKATAEMKERIMFNLFLLAYDHKTEPLMSKRISLLKTHVEDNKDKGPDEKSIEMFITKQCKDALIMMLNDYSQFSISTIDSFVQKVVRSFAFEAGLNASYAVELEKELIISSAIDEMMLSLSHDADLQKWLVGYMNEMLEDSSSWRIEKNLKNLVKIFLEETDYKGFMNLDREEISKYRVELGRIIDTSKAELEGVLRQMKKLCSDNAIDKTFFKGGERGAICKFLLGKKDEAEWINYVLDKKNLEKYFAENSIENGLIADKARADLSDEIISLMKKVVPIAVNYNTASRIKKQLYVIGVLNDIQKHIENILRRENIMPISDTSVLLRRLIDGSPVPFIYEKIGAKYKNIMIDEFQDTSHVQWDNFKPLLHNSIDQNEECLVVGDVKQAIYRWRNSDWRLLAEEMPRAFSAEQVSEIALEYNFRSSANVVYFNNHIFAFDVEKLRDNGIADNPTSLPELLQNAVNDKIRSNNTDIAKIYSKSEQKLPAGKSDSATGYVKINIDVKPEEKKDVPAELAEQILQLHEMGYSYSDMCILIRNNKEVLTFVETLLENDIPFLSSDSLMLSVSPAVKAIMAHYRYMLNPNDDVALTEIVAARLRNKSLSELSVEQRKEICSKEREEVLALRGYDLILMTERIIARLPKSLVQNQYIYVEAFSDQVRKFCTTKNVNLCDFVEFLKTKFEKLTITAPENQDAVTIMTIHKAKGLEFRCVLMPNVSLKINESRPMSYIWTRLPAPFDRINPMPMPYSSSLLFTHAAEAYRQESLMNAIDMLNILYVAFTRAVDVLVVWGESEEELEYKSNTTIARYLFEALKRMKERDVIKMTTEGKRFSFTLGELTEKKAKDKSESEFIPLPIEPHTAHSWVNQIRVNNEGEKERYKSRNGRINYGNVMHAIMERVRRRDDVDLSVDRAVLLGELKNSDRDEIVRTLKERIDSSEQTKQWFSDSMCRVFVETTIMSEGHEYRPDRVMIDEDGRTIVVDYKFGKQHTQKYVTQVREYMQLLKNAGHTVECGYLWYVEENKIEQVVWSAE